MDAKKRTVILVVVALVLAITAIAINVADSEEVSTQVPSDLQVNEGTGKVGIEIGAPVVEDKGAIGDLA